MVPLMPLNDHKIVNSAIMPCSSKNTPGLILRLSINMKQAWYLTVVN